MKTKLLPIYFSKSNDREKKEYQKQLLHMKDLYNDEVEILKPQILGDKISEDADAVLFLQLLGAVFDHRDDFTAIRLPIVVLTSPYGTVEMWDWEIISFLREQLNLQVYAPYSVEIGKTIFRAMSAKVNMKANTRFLMFQDSPGEGMQANIFKRFYWWKQECTEQIEQSFGVQIIYRSWKDLNREADAISDAEADALWQNRQVPNEGIMKTNILKAVKIYIAVKNVIDEIGIIHGVGSNCLNESFHSATTPCLAWNWIYEYDHIIWACEGDTVSLISKYIFYTALKRPLLMTNIYPFLVGMAALKHEKINNFPDITDPDNHALGVHCGYFGLAPQSFCEKWVMRPKVLEIVNDDAIVLDCLMTKGPVVLAKLHADMHKLTIIEAEIEDYVQYPGSDCRNGALIRFRNNNGHKVMEKLSSHHAIIIQGDVTHLLLQISSVYGFAPEII